VLHGLHVLSGHISTRRLTASGSRPLDIGKILEGERSAIASRAAALSIYFFSSCPIRSARVSLAPSSSLSDNECAWLIGAVVGLLQGSKTLQHDTVRERRPNAERERVRLQVGRVAILLGSCWLLLVSSYIENIVWEHSLDRSEKTI
jgi:hypothetical protein